MKCRYSGVAAWQWLVASEEKGRAERNFPTREIGHMAGVNRPSLVALGPNVVPKQFRFLLRFLNYL